jgi:hypothetical protein
VAGDVLKVRRSDSEMMRNAEIGLIYEVVRVEVAIADAGTIRPKVQPASCR